MIDMSMPADGYLVDRLTNSIYHGYCNMAYDDPEHDYMCTLSDDLADGTVTRDDLPIRYPDYYADGTPVLEESFVTTTTITKSDEWDGIFSNRERDFIGRYDDVEPQRCTHATAWWTNTTHGYYTDNHLPKPMRVKDKRTGEYNRIEFSEAVTYQTTGDQLDFEDPRLMRLEFNELQGFVSSRLIDLGITERYHAYVYNVFVGNYDSKLHVGSCVISRTVDNRVQAQCSRKNCKATLIAPHFDDLDRSSMETFIHAVIRHGNNHGPDFITTRPDFTYIHAENCDTDHELHTGCNANTSYAKFEDITALQGTDAVLDFLVKHRKVCVTESCRCTHYYHLLNERNYAHV